MKPCIVQAMCISYPYFAAASGDRIGIWRIDYFMDYFYNQKRSHQQHCEQNKTEKKLSPLDRKHLVAIWNAKVDNCHSRITCVEMTQYEDAGTIIALSCWDGSAFVFRRVDNDDGKSEEKEEWNRVAPKKLHLNSEEEDDDNIDSEFIFSRSLRSWEDPSVDSDIMFPTFLALFSVQIDSNVRRRFMAVTCPGRSIAQCYDIDTGEWYKDIEPSDRSLIEDGTHQGKLEFYHPWSYHS